MSVNNVQEKIFVINLDHNIDRLQNFTIMMNSLGYSFERLKAINGHKYQPDYLSPGEYGCFLSHKKLWKRIYKDPSINRAIIFEDDAELSPKLEDVKHANLLIQHYVNKYDYDVFYLGKCLDRCDLHVSQGPGVVRTYKPLCTHAYVLTKRGAQKLLEFLKEENCIRYPIDVFLNKTIEVKNLLVYAAHPSIFIQNTTCFDSNMRSKLGSLILNTKECCIPQCIVHIYIFLALISIIFIIVTIIWFYKYRK